MKRKLLLLALLAALVSPVGAQSIGMAPSTIQMSDVEPGDSLDFTVYLTASGTSQNITVEPKILDPSVGEIYDDEGFLDPEQYSEQDVENWVTWAQDEFVVDPTTSFNVNTGGSTVVANGQMSGTVGVPQNAEPGFHVFEIGVDPQLNAGEGYGASIFGLARSRYAFRVQGNAERRLEVSDVSARRIGQNVFQFVYEVENTGTVTTSAFGGNATLSQSGSVGATNVPSITVPPGTTREAETRWVHDNIGGGTYNLRGSINYRTGKTFFEESVTFTQVPQQPIEVENPDQQGPEGPEQASVPLLLILVAVLGIGSALYVFGVDMVWSTLISGGVGIAIFIITSGLPVYILLLMLMGAGFLVYRSW